MHLSSKSDKIFVAGHRGLVGSSVIRALERAGYSNLTVRSRAELDLLDHKAVDHYFSLEKPEFVVMAAALVGGIHANRSFPADFLSENLAVQTNVIEASLKYGVKRLVFLGSTCIYPKMAPQPLKEEYLLSGPLEPTNEWYAIAKIAGVKLCEALRLQHGVDFISLMPTNLFGPNDNYDLETSHVLPALLRKFDEAKGTSDSVTIWGSGKARREFLYVDDMAAAILHVLLIEETKLHSVAKNGMLNVGVGNDLTIAQLAEAIKRTVGASNRIEYDSSKPDGTPRKLVDVSRLFSLDWKPKISLEEGLAKTYKWYLEHEKKELK